MNNFGNKNRKQLEEQFRSKFENAQFIPPAHLWEQIDAALDEKPWYKRPLFYWTSGLVAALLLVVMFWFTLVYENNDKPSNTIITDKDNIENSIQHSEKIVTDKNIVNTDKVLEENSITESNPETHPIHKEHKQNDKIVKNTKSNSTYTDTNSTSDKNNTSDIAVSVIVRDKKKDNVTDTNLSDEVETNTEINSFTVLALKEYPLDEFVPFANPLFEMDIFIEEDSTAENAVADTTLPNEETKKTSGIAITLGANYTQGIYQPSFRRDSLYNGLSVIGTYSNNLADTLPQTNISGTYSQMGFDVALQFGKNRRWSLNTGLATGKATYSFGSTNYVRINADLTDTLNLREIPNNQVEVNYEWLQVPIAVGYQFGETRAKKFSGFAQLGTAIEYLNSYSYTSADPDFTYALGTHRIINTNVWTQVGINYHVTNRWAIWAGGTYKSSLSSLINEDGVTFSSQAYGWQVGTRFTVFSSKKK
ncbi:outer membrane beta-barrel protein [Bernardetia sp.]|uniref:outer membrane beta-barrel protein n=1 Tax=Bernardetia sp. TaxID=1937974 RepID=UPI0025C326A4|nr:outer membrane beta-barrel protein [Bernardetia sp.]